MQIEIFEMFSGIGTLTRALVDGLKRQVEAEVVGCVELEARYLRPWSEQHPSASTFAGSCGIYHASELSLPKKPGALRIAVFGIPCVGASGAGKSKNKLKFAEEHGDVGHLFLYVAHFLRRHAKNTDLVVFENVIPYLKSFGAEALRKTLRQLGYHICERQVDSHLEFGAPTQRKRWVLVASRIGAFNWNYTPAKFEGTLEAYLDKPSELDEAESAKPHQVEADAKYIARKAAEGCGWRTIILDRDSTKAPTFVKTYGKRHCVGPFVKTKTSYRMVRPREIARIMGFPESFPLPVSRVTAYEVIGQGVHMAPFRALGESLGGWIAAGRPVVAPVSVESGQFEFAV